MVSLLSHSQVLLLLFFKVTLRMQRAHQQSGRDVSAAQQQQDAAIFRQLQSVLRDHNTYLQSFLTVQERIDAGDIPEDIKVVLHADKRPPGEHARTYNLPTSTEVAILLPSDLAEAETTRVVMCDYRATADSRGLRSFSDSHRSYDPLCYPLLFPFGTDGFHLGITLNVTGSEPKFVTALQFYAYRLMLRPGFQSLHRSCRLFQQYCVDMWAKIETARLIFIRKNQVTVYFFIRNILHELKKATITPLTKYAPKF